MPATWFAVNYNEKGRLVRREASVKEICMFLTTLRVVKKVRKGAFHCGFGEKVEQKQGC